MMGLFCLALGALILLGVDADAVSDARAQCYSDIGKCRADIPRGVAHQLDAKGNLAVDCSTLENDRTCIENLMPRCEFLRTTLIIPFLRFDIKEYLCNNTAAIMRGRYCWPTRGMNLAFHHCISTCAMQSCLEERFLNIPECSDNEAVLMGGIADQFEKYEKHCSVQTQQDTS